MKYRLLDKKILILAGVGVALLSLAYLLLIQPQEMELKKIKMEIREKEALYLKLETLSRLIDELREKKATVSKTIDQFLETRERGETGLVIPDSLINILKESKVEIVSIKPIPEKVEGELLISSWDINILSSYHRLGEFISRLERSPDFNRIDTLTISGGENPSKRNVHLVVSRISLLKKERQR